MKVMTIISFSLMTFLTNGQNKELLGKYTHSFFMYEYILILSDSGKFRTEENSDMGKRTTVGTWERNDKLIKLIPTKAFHSNRSGRVHSFSQEELMESLISINEEYRLTILGSEKQSDTTKYKRPDYKLTKVFN